MKKLVWNALALSIALGSGAAQAWTLEEAAAPYKGTEIKAIFLDRPGYAAAIKLLPEFEKKTGIKVSYETVPYENSREREVLSFTSGEQLEAWSGLDATHEFGLLADVFGWIRQEDDGRYRTWTLTAPGRAAALLGLQLQARSPRTRT